MSSPETLSATQARRLALAAQGLLGPRPDGGPKGVLRRLRAVQLDTISVLARSHELVVYSRLGAVNRRRIEAAFWGGPPFTAFEYWAHAACVLPIEDWPYYEFKRRSRRERGYRWHRLENLDGQAGAVLDKLRSDGPLTANELGGAKRGGPWWDWSDTKIATEWLLDVGDVVCTQRRNFQRVYDIPERAVPADLLDVVLSPRAQMSQLAYGAARALGVATTADVAAYCGLARADAKDVLDALVEELKVVPVRVEGWRPPAFADPGLLSAGTARLRSRPTLLSPFDSLVWDRPRTERVFDFRYRLEAYTPKHKRVHGYYSMPLLVGDSIVGKVDPGRDGATFLAKGVHLETEASAAALEGLGMALLQAASWVGSDDIRVDWVTPEERRDDVIAAVRRAWREGTDRRLRSAGSPR
jgi:uncharacterized protein